MENTTKTDGLTHSETLPKQVFDPTRWYGVGPAGPPKLLMQTPTFALIVDANGAIFDMDFSEQPRTLRRVRIKLDQPAAE